MSFAQISGNKFLFGGAFKIKSRAGKCYEVEYSEEYNDMIGRLVIEYRGDNNRGTVFKPSYIYPNSKIAGIYENKF